MVRKVLFALVIFSMIVLFGSNALITVSGDNDDNDDAAHAETILPGTYYGNVYGDKLPTADYWDFYYFAIQPGDRINVTTAVPLGAVWVVLNGGASDIIHTSSMQYPTVLFQTSNETEFTGLYLGIGDVGSAPTDYSFTLTITQENDAGSGKDASGRFEDSSEVEEGITSGMVDGTSDAYIRQGYDTVDCFRFQAGPEDLINVGFSSASTNVSHMALVDEDSNELANITSLDNQNNTLSHYLDTGSHEGWYYLKISQLLTYAPYSFYLDLSDQDEGGSGHDAPSDFEAAPEIVPGEYDGRIIGGDHSDFYSFDLPPGEIATVSLTSSSDANVTLYDQDHEMTSSGQTMLGILDPLHFASGNESSPLTMFINVSSEVVVDYDLTLLLVPQDDAGSGHDANGSFDSECRIGEGEASGFVGDDDLKDVFRVQVGPGMIINLTMFAYSLSPMQAAYYDSAGVLGFSMQGNGQNISGRICYNDLASSHDGFISIGPGWGSYRLWTDITMQDDIGSGGDAYSGIDYLVNATAIPEGDFLGYMDSAGDTQDTYGIAIQMGQTLNLTIDPFGPMKVDLRNSQGTVVGMYDSSVTGTPMTISWDADADGSVVMTLYSIVGHGEYSISVQITGEPTIEVPGSPALTATPGVGKVTLNWTPPADDGGSFITQYRIYRGTDALGALTILTSINVTQFMYVYVDTDVVYGSTYYYRISAVNDAGEGPRSDAESGSPLAPADDRDNDGMPNVWETDNDLDPDDPTDAAKDADGDGKTNLEEYNDGTDPQEKEKNEDEDGLNFDGLLIGGCCIALVVIAILLVVIFVIVLSRRKGSHHGEE
jgi:hypothetical protein